MSADLMSAAEEAYEARLEHTRVYKSHGWPSAELEAANKRCGEAALRLRAEWGKNCEFLPIPDERLGREEFIRLCAAKVKP